MRTRWLTWMAVLSMAVAAGLMSGCAGPTVISPKVVSHGLWAADRQPGPFVFDRLPSQQAQPEQQAQLEAAALPALLAAGFRLAETGVSPVYTVQIGAQAQVERAPWSRWDPFWDPFWGPRFGPWGHYGAWGPWGPRIGPSPWMAPPPPPHARMQVDVLVRDKLSGQALYEARARYDRAGTVEPALWPALFRAALLRFPTPLPEAVDIEVPWPPRAP